MSDLGILYGDATPVDARWPRLAASPPVMYALYLPDDLAPRRLFATWAEAEAWLDSPEARALGDLNVLPWHPRC